MYSLEPKIFLQKDCTPQGECWSSKLANLYPNYYERTYRINSIHINLCIYVYVSLIQNFLHSNSVSLLEFKCILSGNTTYNNIYDKNNDCCFKINTFTNFKSCQRISVNRTIILYNHFRMKYLCSSKFKNCSTNKLMYSSSLHGYKI